MDTDPDSDEAIKAKIAECQTFLEALESGNLHIGAPFEGRTEARIDDLKRRLPHRAALQFPGPDGVRPSALAERAGVSKQAMNQLLRSLEGLGYIVRSDGLDGSGARLVRLTRHGHAAYAKIHDILRDVEREWSAELGPERFAELKELLSLLWESLSAR